MVQICVNKSAYLGVTYASVFFYNKLYNYLSRLLSCAFSGYCRLFLYMSSKHFVRQGKKAFVQQYQKLYRLLMKVSMFFQYLQASMESTIPKTYRHTKSLIYILH